MSDLIELQELRIGNILMYKGELHYVSHLSMDIDDEYQDIIGVTPFGKRNGEKADWNRAMVNDLRRVLINEEFLLKFGFHRLHHFGNYEYTLLIKNEGVSYNENWSIEVIHRSDDNKYITRLVIEPDEFEPGSITYVQTGVEYIHQLQNLYHGITLKELKIT